VHPSSLLRWDGLHLVVHMPTLERHVVHALESIDAVSHVSLEGHGDALRVAATVVWKGVSSRVAVDVGEIRLKRRFLGFRLRRPRVLQGLPIPRSAVLALVGAAGPPELTVFRGDGIVVFDLRPWLPAELDLSVLTVQATERSIHLWFGAGSLADIPASAMAALPAGEPTESADR
jgi:hypothetical protein